MTAQQVIIIFFIGLCVITGIFTLSPKTGIRINETYYSPPSDPFSSDGYIVRPIAERDGYVQYIFCGTGATVVCKTVTFLYNYTDIKSDNPPF